jgi:hypothetical protein
MGVIYFSLFLFVKIFLAGSFLTEDQVTVLNIITVLSLYLYHGRILIQRVIKFYKNTLREKADSVRKKI